MMQIIPGMMRKQVWSEGELTPESEGETTRGFGHISGSLFSYLTPLMVTIASVVIGIVIFAFPTLYVYFETNIPLNGLILGLLSIGLFRAFNNNFALYRTARFLKEVERATEDPNAGEADVERLQKKMLRQASILDTQNMNNALWNIGKYGHLNFNDNDARLIKSKVGFRISGRKSDVGFLAGILVMLGLLGTFLGLLKTIDSVGAALGSMSNMGGSMSDEQMSGFIGSLSAPLQGMGLAFSSSLFGLSGSLLIGFFNHLCGGAQDRFIENFGRWIDDRIPRYKPEKKAGEGKDAKDGEKKGPPIPQPNDNDLKSILAGYASLAVDTNKNLNALAHNLQQTLQTFSRNESAIQQILVSQQDQTAKTTELRDAIIRTSEHLEGHASANRQLLSQTHQALLSLNENSTSFMSAVQDHVVPAIPKIRDNTAQMNQSLQNLESQTSGHLAALKHDSANILGVMQESNQNILSALSQIVQHSAAGNSSAEQRSTQISTKIEALSSQAQQTYQMLETHMQSILQGVSQANGNAENTKNILGQYFENLAKVIEKSSSEQKEILQQIEQKGSETTRIEKTLLQLEKALFDMRRKLSDVEGLGQKMVQKLSKTPQDKQDKNVDDV